MANQDDLQERLGDTVRQGVATQARAYREYGALLDRLAAQDIKAVEFARDSADLYIGTMGQFASTGLRLAEEAMKVGMKGAGIAVSAAADAVEEGIDPAADSRSADKGGAASGSKRATRKKRAGSAKT